MRNVALLSLLAITVSLGASACSAYRDDRCYLAPDRYEQARLLYDEVGSIELVKQVLRDAGWRRSEINQAEYRLVKEFHLDTPLAPRRETQ